MRRMSSVLLIGLVVPAVWMVTGCRNGAESRSGPDAALANAKYIVKSLKETFQSGQTVKPPAGRGDRPDARMSILVLQVNGKISSTIRRKEQDAARRDKALAKVQEANALLVKEIMPKFEAAGKTKKPEDAKALVPLMDQLDKKLDEIDDVLKG